MNDEKITVEEEGKKSKEKPEIRELKAQKKSEKGSEKKKSDCSEKKEKSPKAQLTQKEIDQLILENADLKAKCNENHDDFLLLAAEFENFKKRTNKDQLRAREFYKESLILDLLPVIDDVDRAIQHHGKDEIGKAFSLIHTQLINYLAKYEVLPFESTGDDFDPHKHDAIMTRSETGKKHNIVLEEFQKGYSIGNKILRHAKVIVNNNE